MDGVLVKEEPLDLDDQGEDGSYSEAEEHGEGRYLYDICIIWGRKVKRDPQET